MYKIFNKGIFVVINSILISSAIAISLYLIIVLISFDPSDPGWLQNNWNSSIHNIGGIIGARCADVMFFVFGILAYIIPLFILLYLWRIYIKLTYITIYIILFEMMKLLVLLFIFCGLLNLIIDNVFYFPSGGIIGCILCDWIFSYENSICYVNLLLSLIGIISMVFFFDQFMTMLKIIKNQFIKSLNTLKIFFYKNKKIRHKYVHYKLCNEIRIFPTVIFEKKKNYSYNLIKNFFKEKKCDNISLNINSFSKKIDFSLKDNNISETYINFPNILKRNDSFAKHQLKYPNLYLNNIFNNNYRRNYIKINNLRKKYSFGLFSKYNKKICKNDNLYFVREKECKNNISLKKKLNLDHIKENNIQKKPASIIKNNKNCFSIVKKSPFLEKNINLIDNIKNTVFPDINLLTKSNDIAQNFLELQNISQLLEKKLAEYRILTNVVNVISGPIITRFELNLSPGTKSSKIVNLSRDLARSLSVMSVRVIEVIPGTPYVGLEIPNKNRRMVCLHNIINSDQFRKANTPLALVLGQDISGNPIIEDLRNMPHLLIAGTTGSGKSVGINAMIIGILYKATPDEVRFIMIDPKILELSIYSNVPHILKKVITDIKDVDETLQWCIQEMERRYQLMAMFGVRSLEKYNCYIEQLYSKRSVKNNVINKFINSKVISFDEKLIKLPYIVIVIDEFADVIITGAKKIEELIIRLTQKARAAGIHLILATQRPSVDVITGLIKANIPARVAFTVSSKIDSHTIIGQSGAESLLGMGDMLYLSANSSIPMRIHGAFIKDQEVHAVVNFWKNKNKINNQ